MEKTKILLKALISSVAIAFLHNFAITHSLYWIYPWLDLLVHFIGGYAIANLTLYFLIDFLRKGKISRHKTKIIIIVVAFSTGLLWEILEFSIGLTFVSEKYFIDTFWDVIMAVIGSLIVVFNLD